MATTWKAIYLGTLSSQIDPNENTGSTTARVDGDGHDEFAEGTADLVSASFGSTGDPLYNKWVSMTPINVVGNATLLDQDQNAFMPGDAIEADLNGDGVVERYAADATVTMRTTITYVDGTTAAADLVYFQTVDGKIFLVPPVLASSPNVALLTAKPILSLDPTAVAAAGGIPGYNGAYSDGLIIDRVNLTIKDFIVEGTAAGDLINSAYTGDPEGDRIDNADYNDLSDRDVVQGFAGNDTILSGTGADTVYAGAGADSVLGGTGNDLIYGYGDTLGGTDDGAADTLRGEAGDDSIYGGGGNDVLDGGADNDLLNGGTGNDTISGGAGNDSILGDAGADSIVGGDGNDTINAGADNDSVLGDAGNDLINLGSGNDSSYGGLGADTIYGDGGNDYLGVGATPGSDTIVGGETEETSVFAGGGDTISFDAGTNETVTFTGNEAGTATTSDGGTITFSQIEHLRMNAGNDIINASAATSTVTAGMGSGDDTFIGGSGADSVFGDAGNDSLSGGGGADTIFGGDGNDFTDGGDGNDLIQGGPGNDTMLGGAGDDTIYGHNPANTDAGADSIDGGAGNDQIFGGFGSDTLRGGIGADTLSGGDDDDRLYVGAGDVAQGGAADDIFTIDPALATGGTATITGGETGEGTGDVTLGSGGDTLDGTAVSTPVRVVYTSNPEAGTLTSGTTTYTFTEIERVDTGAGADTVDASAATGGINLGTGAGADSILGGAGADTIQAGAGADTVNGGAGADTIDFGAGGVVDGNPDRLVIGDGAGADRILRFEGPTGSAAAGYASIDKLNVANLHDSAGNPVDVHDVVVTNDGLGNAVLTFPNGESITLVGVAPSQVDTIGELVAIGIPCFAAGTMIETATGPRAIETLAAGDLVVTRDRGHQPIRWIKSRALSPADLAANPALRPVRIRAGALGTGVPARDLLVSPQHRVLIRSRIAQRMFGTDEVLVAAKQLVMIEGIDLADDLDSVTYLHMLFDQHEIVFSDGAETESLYTGREALKSIGTAAAEEVFAIFPELRDAADQPPPARLLTSGRMGRKLTNRHVQNQRDLVH